MTDNFVRKVNKTGKVSDEPLYTNEPLDLLGEKDNNKAYIRLEREYHCLTNNIKSINGILPNNDGLIVYKCPSLVHQVDSDESYVSIISALSIKHTVGKLATNLQDLYKYPFDVSEQIKPTALPDTTNYYQYDIPKNSDYQYLGIYNSYPLSSLRTMIKLVVIPPKE
jgi:hypothetical protein